MSTAVNTHAHQPAHHAPVRPTPVFWVVSSHWDREWYDSFQGFRYRLLKLLDEVLDLLDDPAAAFECFQMDGQSIPIEDYLEARPERAEQVRRLATAGRLALGPFYVLPDEFIVSGESLVRNLQEGLRIARTWGTPAQSGFLGDIFGHAGQMPQILRGFGIDTAFIWRGLNEAGVGSYLRWVAPDGSAVLANKMGPWIGYCDFTSRIRHSHEPGVGVERERLAEVLGEYIKLQQGRCAVPMPVLLFDGGDHLEVEPETGQLIQQALRTGLAEHYDLRMGTLDDISAAMRACDTSALPVRHGELRYPAQSLEEKGDQQWLISGVLSSRIPLKQANARCEALLTQWAEPWSLFATQAGLAYPHGLLRIAWRHLLANHAHDSICGCSIDQVHRDMMYRFDQARLIAERLRGAALGQLASRITPPPIAGDCAGPRRLILLANPTERPLDEPLDVLVRLPEDTPTFQEFFGYEHLPTFALRDATGTVLPYQRIGQNTHCPQVERAPRKFPKLVHEQEVEVTARVQIPAFGYTMLAVEPLAGPTRHGGTSLVTGPRQAENEFLHLSIGASGLLGLLDKRTGQRYDGLLELEERADIGDGWYHGTAVNDQVFYSGALAASVACVADGPQRAEFLIELEWPLPARFDFAAMRRVPERLPLRIVHRVTLRAGCPRIEVRTTVENTIQDHRLRVLLPSGAQAESYLSDAPFEVVRRPIALDPAHLGWRELELETKPQHSWTAVHDARRGLAVVAQGLPESAVLDRASAPIALTLFRGFNKTVFTNGEPEGQLNQRLSFDYWLVPLDGEPDRSELGWLGQRLAGGVAQHVCEWPAAPAAGAAPAPALPATAGWLELTGAVVVTALRAAATGRMVLRFFNPAEQPVAVALTCPGGFAQAWLCNLDEEAEQPLALAAGRLELDVPAHRIVTLALERCS